MNTYVLIEKYSIEDYYNCEKVYSFSSCKTKEELVEFINTSFQEFKKRVLNYRREQDEYWKNPEIVEFNKRKSIKSEEISQKRKILEKKYSKVPKKDRTPEYNEEIDKIKQEIEIIYSELQSLCDEFPKVEIPSLNTEFVFDDFSISFSHTNYKPNFEIWILEEWLQKNKKNRIHFR